MQVLKIHVHQFKSCKFLVTLISVSLIKWCVNFCDLNFHVIMVFFWKSPGIMDTVKNAQSGSIPLLSPYV